MDMPCSNLVTGGGAPDFRPWSHPDSARTFYSALFSPQYQILINSSLTALGVCTPVSVTNAVISSGGV